MPGSKVVPCEFVEVPESRFREVGLREIELAENVQRLRLTTYEQSRQMVEAADDEAERVSRNNSAKPRSPNGGRPRDATSSRTSGGRRLTSFSISAASSEAKARATTAQLRQLLPRLHRISAYPSELPATA